ncbi:MAG TPA: hypothetical protein VFB62_03280 [Polyangiaceae bacterium]|jgi:hypothetical protein|nr:hypothetical protein [Polyangiaceae bacterium]
MMYPSSARFALLALGLSACVFVTPQSSETRRESRAEEIVREKMRRQEEARNELAAKEAAQKRKEEGPPLPALGQCPADMSVNPGPRTIDTRKVPEARIDYFAKGHTEPPPASFYTDKNKAVELALAAERKTPAMIPAGFREQVKDKPRNAALRLKMARCELEQDRTRRRASYDALIAIFLGGNKDDGLAILIESTRNQLRRKTTQTCTKAADCEAGFTCDPLHKTCANSTEKETSFISAAELDVEDSLSRAVFEPNISFDQAKDSEFFWWGANRLHRCGGQGNVPCEFSGYSGRYVSWDLRDGGRSYSPPEHVQEWYRNHCVTGSITDCDAKKPAWVKAAE